MELKDIIEFIQSRTRTQYKNTVHSDKRLEERGLDIESIIRYIQDGNLVSITEQDDNVYKLLIIYNDTKDLCIILKIDNEKIKLITSHLIENKRRKKNGKTT